MVGANKAVRHTWLTPSKVSTNKVKSQYPQSQSILIFRILLKQKIEYKIAVQNCSKIAVQNCSKTAVQV